MDSQPLLGTLWDVLSNPGIPGCPVEKDGVAPNMGIINECDYWLELPSYIR